MQKSVSGWLMSGVFLSQAFLNLACSSSKSQTDSSETPQTETTSASTTQPVPTMQQADTTQQPDTMTSDALIDEGACERALFCDDFESATDTLSAPWAVSENGTHVTVSSERAFSGTQSVLVDVTEGAYKRGYLSIEGEPVFPAAANELYGRMMMWAESTPMGSVHWTFIQGEGPGEPSNGEYTAVYRYGGQMSGRLMANYETFDKNTDCWDHSATTMPVGTWACMEWHFNTESNLMEFWLDGKQLKDITINGKGEGCVDQDLNGQWLAPTAFEVIRVGWERYQQSDTRRVWIDDVAFDTARLGCPQ